MIKIAFDIMGYENDLLYALDSAKKFVKKYNDTTIILVGNEKKILEKMPIMPNNMEIFHSENFITQEDNPLIAIRRKDTSMYQAIDLVKNNKADAVLSAGSTPAFVSISYNAFGLLKNVTKPAFTPTFPSSNGKGFVMLDVGANKSCNEIDLVNFAKMGHIYTKFVRNINNPTIKLLNNGTEKFKGLDSIVAANKILEDEKEINYQGYIEPNILLKGETDVIISDGFTGNIALKAMEGAMKILSEEFKKNFKKPSGWLGGLFGLPTFKKVKETFNYKNYAGALVLGLTKNAIKAHGSADDQEFTSALELARLSVKKNVIEEINKFLNGK